MHATHIVNILISLLYAGLGFFVLLRNPANVINKRFCIVANTFCVWASLIFFTLQTTDPLLATFRLRLVFCAATFIPSTLFFFSSVFPDRTESVIDRYFSILFFAISVILSFFSSLIVNSVSFEKHLPHPNYGPLFTVFCFYFVACSAYSVYILYKKKYIPLRNKEIADSILLLWSSRILISRDHHELYLTSNKHLAR